MSPLGPQPNEDLDLAFGRLREDAVPPEDAARAQARRDRILPGLRRLSDDAFAARRRRLFPVLAAAAAAAALVVVAVHGFDRDAPASALRAVPAPERVETKGESAEIELASGAHLVVEPRTRLDLGTVTRTGSAIDERISMTVGRIRVRVPKLSAGSRLVVQTPRAIVTVHGTEFVVEVTPAAEEATAHTRVSVSEGRVSVASHGREVFLGPGGQWSSAGAAPAVPPRASASPPLPALETPAPPGAPSSAPVASKKRPSTLAAENELFRSAVVARSGGSPRLALERLDALLTQFPTSPLAPAARAERERILEEIAADRR